MKKIIQIIFMLLFLPSSAYNLEFFTRFNDNYLKDYILEALVNNHSLKEADKRVEQYRYEINSAFSKEFPTLSVSGSYLGTHVPNGDFNVFMKKNSFVMPFRVNYEPDILLKTKDKINSKKYLYKSSLANQKAVYLALLGDVASGYLNILLYDFLIEKQKEILNAKEKKLKFNYNKLYFGVIDKFNLNLEEEEFNAQQLIYDTLIKNQQTAIYNFALLLGRSCENNTPIKRGNFSEFEYLGIIPDTINSDIIYLRPDLIEIENKIKSAKLDITAAKKDFFPSFNITAFLAFDTAGGGNFFAWNSAFAYLIAGATQDLFKGGEKIAALKIKRAKFYELVEKYKQTNLTAIKEISNALNIIKQDTKNEKTSKAQLDLERKNFLISAKKFQRGIISNTDYLDNKNSFIQQEQISAYSKAARICDYITLYKALGGEL